jgi:hypothetical protein
VGEDVIVKVFSPLQRNTEPKAIIIIIATATATKNQRENFIHSTSKTKTLSGKYKRFSIKTLRTLIGLQQDTNPFCSRARETMKIACIGAYKFHGFE